MELTLGLHLTQLLILLNALATPVRGISVLSRVINPIKTLPPAQEMAAPEISRKVFVLDTCRLDQLQDLLFFFPNGEAFGSSSEPYLGGENRTSFQDQCRDSPSREDR